MLQLQMPRRKPDQHQGDVMLEHPAGSNTTGVNQSRDAAAAALLW
jgi:hypothetical protein